MYASQKVFEGNQDPRIAIAPRYFLTIFSAELHTTDVSIMVNVAVDNDKQEQMDNLGNVCFIIRKLDATSM